FTCFGAFIKLIQRRS
ncbi:hypothetical protein JTB14_031471, partial [Gonioctena quinquepunctata]